MVNWIVALIIISTVLACWSFSLFLRLISEFVARKRKRLRAQHHRRGVVYALIAMCLGLAGAGLSGVIAFYLMRQHGGDISSDAQIVGAVSFGLLLFASMLLVWALIGDRPRGRLRCPRCWYDMAGTHDPRCPECGKAIKSPKHLRRARRLRWPFLLASLCVGSGAYGIVHLERIEESSALALVPTSVLMIGWELFPERWIMRGNWNAYPGSLHDRIKRGWISTATLDRFGRDLIDSMPDNKADRWNKRRMHLLANIYNNNQIWLRYDDESRSQPPDNIDYGPLLQLVAGDVLHALTTQSPDAIDIRILETFSDHKINPYNLLWTWLVFRSDSYIESEQYPGRIFNVEYMNSPVNHAVVTNAMKGVLPLFQDADFDSLISHESEAVREAAFRLAIDTGLVDADPEIFFESKSELGTRRSRIQQYLGRVLHLLPPDSQVTAFELLSEWIRSDDPGKRAFGVSSIQYLQNNIGYNRTTPVPAYHRTVHVIIDHALSDDRAPYSDNTKLTISHIASSVIVRYDTVGDLSFPVQLLRIDRGLNPAGSIRWPTHARDTYQRSAALWYDSFEEHFGSSNPRVRQWIIDNTPTQSGASIDNKLNALAAGYLFDDESSIRASAFRVLLSRGAQHLIPEGYDPQNPPAQTE